jgi:outer membrane protein assembly factor BamB
MTMPMLRRRAALTLSLGLLASCSTPKAKIIGKQIPVLPETGGFDVLLKAPPVSVPAPVALAEWPQPLANAAHMPGNVAGPSSLAKPRWTAHIGAPGGYRQPLQASPLIAAGKVFAMDANGVVSAYALADGSRVWRSVTRPKHAGEQNIGGGIAYAEGKVYASTGYAELLAMDAANGKILWRQDLNFPTRTAPMVAGGLVAVVVQTDLLLTFDAKSGTPGWRFTGSVGEPPTTAVAVTGAPAFAEGIIVAGFSSGTLAALDANSGTPVWEQSLAASFGKASPVDLSDIVAAPVIANGVVYAIGLGNTTMAVDLHSGAKVWTHSATGTQPYVLAGDYAFLLNHEQQLIAINADDGLVSWATQMPDFHNMKNKSGPIAWTGPVMVDGHLVLGNSRGEVARVDAVTGDIASTQKLSGPADMPAIAAAGVLVQLARDAKLTVYG